MASKMEFFLAICAFAAIIHYSNAVCRDLIGGGWCDGMKPMCKIHKDYTKKWCPKTCGHCGPTTNPPIPPTHGPIGTQGPISCGNPQIQHGRVIAGTNAVPHSWPWQALMIKNGRGGCGGSLIAPQWVVSAAHCVYKDASRPYIFKIRLGEHSLDSKDGLEQDYQVEKVIYHPQWNPRNLDYDIALFKLSKPVIMNKYISPVCLPSGDVPVGTECYITGWGKIRHPGSMHHTLQQAKMPVVSNDVCHSKNKQVIPIPITSRMVCSGHGGSTRISGCHGDSGGPFVCNIGGRWELHGAVSHGSPQCKASQTYTVFARVNYFKNWILQNMSTQ